MPTWYGQAIRLASTINLSREAWLQIRMRGIGSSDAAVAVGLSPYKSALSLWLEKTGRRESEDISDKPAVFWGTRLEALIADVYAEQTGSLLLRHTGYLFRAIYTVSVGYRPSRLQIPSRKNGASFAFIH